MKSIDWSRGLFGCIHISRTGLGVFFAALLVGSADSSLCGEQTVATAFKEIDGFLRQIHPAPSYRSSDEE